MTDPRPTDQTMIALDHVGVRFGGVDALVDVTLRIDRREFVALVGANGSGKTTLLRTLHGLTSHSGSRTRLSAAELQAMVFQRPFMLRLSALNNLRVALWLAGVRRRERSGRAAEALERAGLESIRNRSAPALSSGQQQRLALARAWAIRPAVLLLDEPTANLDPAAKVAVEAMLASFAQEGMTIVMATHNLGQAQRLATRVVHIDQGRINADLPTGRFFGQHLGPRAESFLDGELRWAD